MSDQNQKTSDALKEWRISSLLGWTKTYFQNKGIENPRFNAEVLLAHVLSCERMDLYLNYENPVSTSTLDRFKALIQRRIKREPLQYIVGEWSFWSFSLKLDPRVLIPRPETEVLVEAALKWHKTYPQTAPIRFLDLGTGSGAITFALLKEIPEARADAVDISVDALDLAKMNAKNLDLDERVTFYEGDLFQPLSSKDQASFDLVVSNPPYISIEQFPDLQPEVKHYEPQVALLAKEGGVAIIQRIVDEAFRWLTPGGSLWIEIGDGQAQKCLSIVHNHPAYEKANVILDDSKIPRILFAIRVG